MTDSSDDFQAAVQAAVNEMRSLLDEAFSADSWPTGWQMTDIEKRVRHVGAVARRDALRACWDAAEGFSLLNVHAAYEAAKAEAEQAMREVTT